MRIRLPAGSRTAQSRIPYGLVGRLLDDFRVAGLQPREGAVEVGGGQVDAGVGSLGHHLCDRAALVVGDAGARGRRIQDDRRARLAGGPTVIQCIPPYSTSLRTSKPRVSR
jgi:hypothetical protein